MPGIFTSIDISATGLTVQRQKMDVVAENIANAETTRTPEGGPYRRKRLVAAENTRETSFRNEMTRAKSRLVRTDPGHISGGTKRLPQTSELSEVKADIKAAPADDFRLVYDPSHPEADQDGFVKMPDVEVVTEMVDMLASSRAYEANTMAISAAKDMAKNALEI
nr:flagellar basal body rod protein FlgC [candidate division Zixibacteria bacterium]